MQKVSPFLVFNIQYQATHSKESSNDNAAILTSNHVDLYVRRRRGVVPERQRAVPMQRLGDRVDVRHDARDVGRGGERTRHQFVVAVLLQRVYQRVLVDGARRFVLADLHDQRAGLAPGCRPISK